MTAPASPPRSRGVSSTVRAIARLLPLLLLALSLAACASSATSAPDLIGPYPSVTAVIRADVDGGQVELLGVRVSPVDLQSAATELAGALFGPDNIGEATPTNADTGAIPDTLLSTTVPVELSPAEVQLAISEQTVDAAVASLKPRSTAVWVCTDDQRSLQVVAQAPGAVSSDIASGTCQVAGSSIAKDGVSWTAAVTIGPVTEPSLVPELLWSMALLLGAAALGAFLWSRRAARRADAQPPTAAPVH